MYSAIPDCTESKEKKRAFCWSSLRTVKAPTHHHGKQKTTLMEPAGTRGRHAGKPAYDEKPGACFPLHGDFPPPEFRWKPADFFLYVVPLQAEQ